MKKAKRNRSSLIVVLVLVMTFVLAGCSSATVEETTQPTEEVQQPEVETDTEIEEGLTEEVQQPVEEPKTEENMEEWLTEVGSQGTICLVVWNDSNSTKHIIEKGERYNKNDGDRFFVCSPSRVCETDYITASEFNLGRPFENYCEVTFGEYSGEDEIYLEFKCEAGEEAIIEFTMINSAETETKVAGMTGQNP